MSQPSAGPRRRLDPRVLGGVAVTGIALWWAFRSVPLADLIEALRGADLWVVVLPSAACYYASLWIRVLRWRHLAAGLGELPYRPAYRATAIRFMANNLFPLRVGELAGAWVVARDVGGSGAAWFGTIVLERAFDSAAIMSLAVFLVAGHIDLGPLRYLAFAPMAGVAALRLWPGPLLRLGHRILRALLPSAWAARSGHLVDQLAGGLSGIRGLSGLGMVILHTIVLWGLVGTLPFLFALDSLGIELGTPAQQYIAALSVMVGVGVAVAVPQAPGFVGVYHFACSAVLTALGVPKPYALAMGTLAHAVFWFSITGFGLLALRGRRASFAEALRAGRQ